jgi:serine protease AprX
MFQFRKCIRKKAVWGATVLSALMLAAWPAQAQTAATDPTSRFDEIVREAWATGTFSRVIMRFATTADRDRAFGELLDRGAAVRVMDDADSPSLNVYSSPAAFGSVDYAERVSYDAPVTVSAVTQSRAKFVRGLGASVAQDNFSRRGTGVTVAVVDSGFLPHPDIPSGRILKYKDFVTGGTTLADGCGHGTHVAGIIAGSGGASNGLYKGVAPESNLVILRVLGDDCSGRTSDVIEALQWVYKNRGAYGIKVVNLSLGHPVFEPSASDPLVKIVQKLAESGVVVVTAAGNMGINPKTGAPGYGGVGVPCNAPRSICVGAGDTQNTESFGDDRVTDYSSRGPTRFDFFAKPDVVATGHHVVSLSAPGSFLFTNYSGLQVVGGTETDGQPARYMTLSGTSMASPMVAGAAAQVLGANPRLQVNTVKMILQFTSRVLPGIDALTQGAGYLNSLGATRLASMINARAPQGAYWLRRGSVPGVNEDMYGQTVQWGKRIIWGDRFINGDAAYIHLARWDDNIVWGMDTLLDNIVWGTCTDGCDNIVWGNYWDELDNIVWGTVRIDDNVVWGENVVWGFDGFALAYWADNVVWGFWDDNVVWGDVSRYDQDNIVWGNDWEDNIVWGQGADDDNVVWGNNVVWGFNIAVLTGGVQ